jgi:adenosylcobinamide amidohydrolase
VKKNLPRVSLQEDALVVSFRGLCRTLGWAPLGGGLTVARHWINHQVQKSRKFRHDMEPPAQTLRRVAKQLGLSGNIVGQMTSGNIRSFKKTVLTRKNWTVLAVGTAGFSNAVRVGERASHGSNNIGTINLLVWVSKPLALPTLLEVLQIAVEARTLAVLGMKVKSRATGAPATGTGTDCVTVACPFGKGSRVYAGKHTVLGELVGKVVLKVMGHGGKRK